MWRWARPPLQFSRPSLLFHCNYHEFGWEADSCRWFVNSESSKTFCTQPQIEKKSIDLQRDKLLLSDLLLLFYPYQIFLSLCAITVFLRPPGFSRFHTSKGKYAFANQLIIGEWRNFLFRRTNSGAKIDLIPVSDWLFFLILDTLQNFERHGASLNRIPLHFCSLCRQIGPIVTYFTWGDAGWIQM